MYTIREKLGKLKGLTIAIVGDIAHSRVARSNIYGLSTMGAKVRVCGPPTMIPPGVDNLGAQVYYDMNKAVEGVDAVMMIRLQLERQTAGLFPGVREYARFYGLNQVRVELAAQHVLVMHPGPMNRGVEISSEVADGTPVILDQVTNGVAVRMAVMYLLSGGSKAEV
jgi:aspartate carbamoyltransferase catalytic subunit